jgi:hypothetical protein
VSTPRLSLDPKDAAVLGRVRTLISQALGPRRANVYLFGSWAAGTRHAGSDIDVAVEPVDPLPPGVLARVRETLEESSVPYRVDVVDLTETDAGFRHRVKSEGILWIGSASA